MVFSGVSIFLLGFSFFFMSFPEVVFQGFYFFGRFSRFFLELVEVLFFF